MSISSALYSAVSGLAATSRAADVVASNLANVMTEGYAPRQLELESVGRGLRGVKVTAITRDVDLGLLSDRRLADSELAYNETRAQFLTRMEQAIGTPDQATSLTARLAAFEASMVSASTYPENDIQLRNTVIKANELVSGLNAASAEVQRQRTETDGQIATAVESVNTLLQNIKKLNVEIANHGTGTHLAASLHDQQQQLVDQLSEFIPVRQVPREKGTIALFTPGGAILLDGTAAELEFTASNVVAPHMTLDNGLLSGLSINGVTVSPSGEGSPIEGGKLSALFSVRDDLTVDMQNQLDAVTRDLIERFQQPGLDATRAPGDPGLFTDAGGAFDPLNEIGIAGRINLNAAVDADQGGAYWRLRDGLAAAAPGPEGNGALLSQLSAVLSEGRSLASGDLGATPRSASGHLGMFSTRLGGDRLALDQALSFAASRQSQLASLELEEGVDSDAEMQKLLLIEQAYGANARMIQTLDDMMQTLLRI